MGREIDVTAQEAARPGRLRGGFLLPALVGWWLATLVGEVAERREARTAASALASASRALPPPLPHPRALRAARGSGRRRSGDLARFLWNGGPEAPIETLRGFGPTTAAAAREVLDSPGSGSRCPRFPPYNRPAGCPPRRAPPS